MQPPVHEPKRKPKWRFKVIEVRRYQVLYTVEADTLDQAKDMAEVGNTIDETQDVLLDVVHRGQIEPA